MRPRGDDEEDEAEDQEEGEEERLNMYCFKCRWWSDAAGDGDSRVLIIVRVRREGRRRDGEAEVQVVQSITSKRALATMLYT